jgi:hypothetical protein
VYHIVSYILFVFNVIVGFLAGLKRVLLSLIFSTFTVGRLDRVLLMRGFERFDTG